MNYSSTTALLEYPPLPLPDKLMGCFSVLCFLIGTPLNILSVIYFRKQKPSASSVVYIAIASTDSWISFNGYPYAILMLWNREPLLYANDFFMQLWGLSWEPFPYFSVYLVLVISLLRTLKVTRPLIVLKRKYALTALCAYAVFLITRYLTGLAFFGKYNMFPYDTYPYMNINNDVYSVADFYLAVASLACPIIPIIISCVICMTTILRSKGGPKGASAGGISSGISSMCKMRTKATVTVLIFTLVYILCNIPVVICVARYAVLQLWGRDVFMGPNLFLARYIWPITYIALVQLNALINPFVYLCRMDDFRQTAKRILCRSRRKINVNVLTAVDDITYVRYNVRHRAELVRGYEMTNLGNLSVVSGNVPTGSQNSLAGSVSVNTLSVNDFHTSVSVPPANMLSVKNFSVTVPSVKVLSVKDFATTVTIPSTACVKM